MDEFEKMNKEQEVAEQSAYETDVDGNDDKMPTTHVTTTKKKYFANPTGSKSDKEEMWDAVYDIADSVKEQYKSASAKDKAILLAIFLPLTIFLLIGVAGIFLANYGQYFELRRLEIAGIVLIAVGLGGFFLFIVGLIIWSKIKR